MRTVMPNAARDTVVPTLHKAQETLNGTVLPVVRDTLTTVRERGGDLLDTDVALEARRRGTAVFRAAKGEVGVTPVRSKRFGFGMLALGTGLGIAVMWIAKRLTAPVDTYTQTMPVPSGTDGGTTTQTVGTSANGAAPAGTAAEDIDLTAGSPANS